MRIFFSLFDCLIEAGEILSGKYDENPDERPVLSSKVSAAFIQNLEIINDPDSKFLKKVFDEIDNNLYDLSKGKEVYYIKDVLRGFVGIMPYLDPFTMAISAFNCLLYNNIVIYKVYTANIRPGQCSQLKH